jgi:uncharacterized delta-60 repeat protein
MTTTSHLKINHLTAMPQPMNHLFKNRSVIRFTWLAALGLAANLLANPDDLDLDQDFGSGSGVAKIHAGGENQMASAMTVLPDGRILMTGTVIDESGFADVLLIRLTRLGQPDPSFGGGSGFVRHDLSGADDYGLCLAVQSDGKIVVGGSTDADDSGFDALVARFHSNGELDESFSEGTGYVIFDLEGEDDEIFSVALAPNNDIITVGYTTDSAGGEDLMVDRFTTQGDWNSEFGGGNGGFVQDLGGFNDVALDLVMNKDGGFLVAGYSEDEDGSSDGFVAAYDATGTMDANFGEDEGITFIDVDGRDDSFYVILPKKNGGWWVAGQAEAEDGNSDFLLASIAADGTSDLGFGSGDGYVTTDVQGGEDSATALFTQPGGKIVVSGTSVDEQGLGDLGMVCYLPDGQLNREFGTEGGILIHDLSGGDELINGGVAQLDGKWLLCGESYNEDDGSEVLVGRILSQNVNVGGPEIGVQTSEGIDLSSGTALPSFGSVHTQSSVGRQLRITNSGTSVLTGIKLSLTGKDAGEFSLGNRGKDSLKPGESLLVGLAFKPVRIGQKSVTILIVSNDADENPFRLNLSGIGVGPEIFVYERKPLTSGRSKVTFGGGAGKPVTKVFEVRNVGNRRLTELAVQKTGASSKSFNVSPIPVKSLDPGERVKFKVTFKTNTRDSRTTNLMIKSNDADENPFVIKVSG